MHTSKSEVVYFLSDLEPNYAPVLGLVVFGFVLLIVLLRTSFLQVISKKLRVAKNVVAGAVGCFYLLLISSTTYSTMNVGKINERFKIGALPVVEGCIDSIKVTKGNSREESFNVANVNFTYNDYGTAKHFFRNETPSDQFITEGRCVSIIYVKDKINYIVKIVEL